MARKLSRKEIQVFKKLLKRVLPVPNVPRELFVLIMSKCVPATSDIAIVRNHKVLLYYDDTFFMGWAFPGSYIQPGETLKQAARRVALKELGINVHRSKLIATNVNVGNTRFQDVSLLSLCTTKGEPKQGRWFSRQPSNMVPVHKKLWSAVKPYLK